MTRTVAARDYSLDNIRFFLIFSVVFAHLLEVCKPFAGSQAIYQSIYTFHMPAFIFLFGYLCKYSMNRIVFRWCIPYVIFQGLYLLFSIFILKENRDFQLTTPYWLLWYILACIYYQLLLPIFNITDSSKQIVALLCTFLVSLLVGFDDSIGYYMSLSRFFVFQPWFLLGYYCRKNNCLENLSVRQKTRFIILFASLLVIVLLTPACINMPTGLLYGSYPYYSSRGGTPLMRIVVSLVSFAWIMLLVCIKPHLKTRIFLLTKIGQNTWPVFLLHGFLIKAISMYWPGLARLPWRVLILSCVILAIFGNPFFNRFVYYISFSWLENLPINIFLSKVNTKHNDSHTA